MKKVSEVKFGHQGPNKRKDWFFINTLDMQYTNGMEKAMYGAHGVGYETYKRQHQVRVTIEKKREKEYVLSQRVKSGLERKIHS
ncbi:hypothetical protein KHA96_21270 [Bacillus sp. FJAT-49711]|uniref:hypothetical protein n=1 Tax=Bacillus sp. FJAT-49711 TaxID=2833585 RepID=UPI001BCA4854|nr:hypothetical protein [Bacillus sp. FJAT-49711]MBS4220832.1 hypothetical protein [Bacillus sp. FJAT-49711]